MPLSPVRLEPDDLADLGWRTVALLDEAQRRIDAFLERSNAPPGFVTSDFEAAARTLEAIRLSPLPSDTFCEWGSGFGVVAGIAALTGFQACGIEVRPELVRESRSLLEDLELDVEIHEASFLPRELEGADSEPTISTIVAEGADDHPPVDVADFDVIYAFPWPGEEDLYFRLFEERAARGACLLTYHGVAEGLLLQQKL